MVDTDGWATNDYLALYPLRDQDVRHVLAGRVRTSSIYLSTHLSWDSLYNIFTFFYHLSLPTSFTHPHPLLSFVLQASIDTIATGVISTSGASPVVKTSFGNWHNSFYTVVDSCLPQGCYTASLHMDPHTSKEGTQASTPACENIFLAPLHPHQVSTLPPYPSTHPYCSHPLCPLFSCSSRRCVWVAHYIASTPLKATPPTLLSLWVTNHIPAVLPSAPCKSM